MSRTLPEVFGKARIQRGEVPVDGEQHGGPRHPGGTVDDPRERRVAVREPLAAREHPGVLRRLLTSTNLPDDALDYQRFETKGFVVFLEPGIRAPRELNLQMVGHLRRRLKAFWNGYVFVPARIRTAEP